MDDQKVLVQKYDGGTVTLDISNGESVKEVLKALEQGGYVVLKHATNPESFVKKENLLSNKVGLYIYIILKYS